MPSLLKSSRVRAPSNIALVKYMGKSIVEGNLPANGSLSLTLNSLCTGIELEIHSGKSDFFTALSESPRFSAPLGFQWQVPNLSEKGIQRFAKRAERCLIELPAIFKQYSLDLDEPLVQSLLNKKSAFFVLRSANTFPAGAGIASSASSFAALTLAMAALLAKNEDEVRVLYRENKIFRRALAALSQKGSGSSCRSFEGPFVQWSETHTETVPSKFASFTDFVLVISSEEKAVGSSEAHERVLTSPLWLGRPERAEARITCVQDALAQGNLEGLSQVVWAEAEDMHSLFHTAQPPFTYQSALTHEVLKKLKEHPEFSRALVTLDAGPNVHVIVPTAQAAEWRAYFAQTFPMLNRLEDTQGEGAEIL